MRKLILSLWLVVMLFSLCCCSHDHDHPDEITTVKRTIECRLHYTDSINALLATQIPDSSGGQLLRDTLSAYYHSLLFPATNDITFDVYDSETSDRVTTIIDKVQGQNGTYTLELPYGNLWMTAATQKPLYSGRLKMPVGQDRFTMHLYPASAQVAVAINADKGIKDLRVRMEGCAIAFNVSDSTYTFSSDSVQALTYQPTASTSLRRTYAGSILVSQPGKPWRVIVLATTATGSVTRTVLTVREQLLPGDIKVLLATVKSNGATETTNVSVGASVTLDWKEGNEYNSTI